MKKQCCNSIPLEASELAKIRGDTNICFYKVSALKILSKCLYLSDPKMLLQCVTLQQNEDGTDLPEYADSPDAEKPAICANGS